MQNVHVYTCICMLYLSQVGDWIHDKLTVATDESYRDPTNLQSKLQKHQAFEAELSANKGRVDSVCKVRFSTKSKSSSYIVNGL